MSVFYTKSLLNIPTYQGHGLLLDEATYYKAATSTHFCSSFFIIPTIPVKLEHNLTAFYFFQLYCFVNCSQIFRKRI